MTKVVLYNSEHAVKECEYSALTNSFEWELSAPNSKGKATWVFFIGDEDTLSNGQRFFFTQLAGKKKVPSYKESRIHFIVRSYADIKNGKFDSKMKPEQKEKLLSVIEETIVNHALV